MLEENGVEQAESFMPELNEANVVSGNNVVDGESGGAELNGGDKISVAPTVESVTNTEGMYIAEEKAKKSGVVEKKFKFPNLFVEKDSLVDVEVDVIFDPSNGDVYSITQADLIDLAELHALECVTYKFGFKPISYNDIRRYREQASFYDSTAGDLVINRLTLRSLFMISHLRSTNMVGVDGSPIELEIDGKTDHLTIDSLRQITETLPALMDVVMSLFERKQMMLFQVGG